MPRDLRPGPDSPPTDELESAEACLAVLQHVVHPIASDDLSRKTPCSEYDVRQLTGHLLNSIRALGGMVGADIPAGEDSDSVERQIVGAARPALDAWRRRGLDGSVAFGNGKMAARDACAAWSLEFLVHAWDYAKAVGHDVDVREPLAEYVLELGHRIVKPELRAMAGFDDPVEAPEGAGALDRLVAFTGRNPARAK
ncbi:TIGR03086 family metal-binding protein [Mycobacterium servetii]|uniref:TIGR03086 family metal-binding protein n=1 Tax=Mycobacterium servetii TaxID=3237418 RepID=A0ABV4BXJ5_9MYCO